MKVIRTWLPHSLKGYYSSVSLSRHKLYLPIRSQCEDWPLVSVPVRTSRLRGCEQRFGYTSLQRSIPHTCVTHSPRADPDDLSDSRTASSSAGHYWWPQRAARGQTKGSLGLKEQSRAGCYKSDGEVQEAVHPVYGFAFEMFTSTNILLRDQLPMEFQRHNFWKIPFRSLAGSFAWEWAKGFNPFIREECNHSQRRRERTLSLWVPTIWLLPLLGFHRSNSIDTSRLRSKPPISVIF